MHRKKLDAPRPKACASGCNASDTARRLLQSTRFPSTATARTRSPYASPGVAPQQGADTGRSTPCGADQAGTSRVRELPRPRPRQHSSRTSRVELYPEPCRPGHLLSRARAPAGWSLRTGIPKEEPRFPTSPPAADARGAVRTRAAYDRPLAKGTGRRAPEVPFLDGRAEARYGSPQAVTNLWSIDTAPFASSRNPSAFDVPRGAATGPNTESGKAESVRGRSVPNRLLRFGSSAARCAAELPTRKVPRLDPLCNQKIMRPNRPGAHWELSTNIPPGHPSHYPI